MSAWAAILAVAVGGSLGAVIRYVTETWAVARWGTSWPWGTFAVNITGSLILGTLTGISLSADLPQALTLFLGTGFCGALTTFSSFSLQIVDLARSQHVAAGLRAVAYAAISLGAGLLAAGIPYVILRG